jgi:hypothetical protein
MRRTLLLTASVLLLTLLGGCKWSSHYTVHGYYPSYAGYSYNYGCGTYRHSPSYGYSSRYAYRPSYSCGPNFSVGYSWHRSHRSPRPHHGHHHPRGCGY